MRSNTTTLRETQANWAYNKEGKTKIQIYHAKKCLGGMKGMQDVGVKD